MAPAETTSRLTAVTDLPRLLKYAGAVAEVFTAESLFDLYLDVIQPPAQGLFNKVRVVAEEAPRFRDAAATLQISQTASSNYVSVAEDGSDTSSEPRRMGPRRMCLSPSGTSMLEARAKAQERNQARPKPDPTVPSQQQWADSSRKRGATSTPGATATTMNHGLRDVEMESLGATNSHDGYDPDNLDCPSPIPAAVITAAAGVDGSSLIQGVRISVISDLKELTGNIR
ncbi:hypothetical protein PInf_002617 [Phytophthora infestans]|nr:hypothetical protein PInf_002617 [Phytophthora infestans]